MKNKLINLLSVLSFSFVVLMLSELNSIPNAFIIIIFLPIIYLLLINIKPIKQMIDRYLTLKIFIVLAFLKYVVLIYLMVHYKSYDSLGGNSTNYLFEALFFMIYELIAIGLFLIFFNNRKKFNFNTTISLQDKNSKNLLIKLSVIIGLFGFIFYDEFLSSVIWFSDSSSLLENQNYIKIEGWFMGLIFYFSKFVPTLIFLLLLANLKQKYPNKIQFKFLIPTLFFSVISILLVFTENRGIIVSTGITTIIIIHLYYPQFKKRLTLGFMSIILISVTVSTVFRMLNTTLIIEEDTADNLYDLFLEEATIITLDAYLSGPSNVSAALKSSTEFKDKISYVTLINDIIINTNILNQISYRLFYTNLINDRSSVYLSNIVNGGRIPPLIYSGYVFVGIFFAPFFSVLAIYFMLIFERNYIISKNIFIRYALLYIAVRFSFSLGLSISVLYALFVTYFLPFWLISKVNQKFNIK